MRADLRKSTSDGSIGEKKKGRKSVPEREY
jgi:hypothetical protein